MAFYFNLKCALTDVVIGQKNKCDDTPPNSYEKLWVVPIISKTDISIFKQRHDLEKVITNTFTMGLQTSKSKKDVDWLAQKKSLLKQINENIVRSNGYTNSIFHEQSVLLSNPVLDNSDEFGFKKPTLTFRPSKCGVQETGDFLIALPPIECEFDNERFINPTQSGETKAIEKIIGMSIQDILDIMLYHRNNDYTFVMDDYENKIDPKFTIGKDGVSLLPTIQLLTRLKFMVISHYPAKQAIKLYKAKNNSIAANFEHYSKNFKRTPLDTIYNLIKDKKSSNSQTLLYALIHLFYHNQKPIHPSVIVSEQHTDYSEFVKDYKKILYATQRYTDKRNGDFKSQPDCEY